MNTYPSSRNTDELTTIPKNPNNLSTNTAKQSSSQETQSIRTESQQNVLQSNETNSADNFLTENQISFSILMQIDKNELIKLIQVQQAICLTAVGYVAISQKQIQELQDKLSQKREETIALKQTLVDAYTDIANQNHQISILRQSNAKLARLRQQNQEQNSTENGMPEASGLSASQKNNNNNKPSSTSNSIERPAACCARLFDEEKKHYSIQEDKERIEKLKFTKEIKELFDETNKEELPEEQALSVLKEWIQLNKKSPIVDICLLMFYRKKLLGIRHAINQKPFLDIQGFAITQQDIDYLETIYEKIFFKIKNKDINLLSTPCENFHISSRLSKSNTYDSNIKLAEEFFVDCTRKFLDRDSNAEQKLLKWFHPYCSKMSPKQIAIQQEMFGFIKCNRILCSKDGLSKMFDNYLKEHPERVNQHDISQDELKCIFAVMLKAVKGKQSFYFSKLAASCHENILAKHGIPKGNDNQSILRLIKKQFTKLRRQPNTSAEHASKKAKVPSTSLESVSVDSAIGVSNSRKRKY